MTYGVELFVGGADIGGSGGSSPRKISASGGGKMASAIKQGSTRVGGADIGGSGGSSPRELSASGEGKMASAIKQG
jgi:hypothetical protein